jgi:hypothetical protein
LPRGALAVCLLGAVAGLGASAARMLPGPAVCSAASYSHHVALVVELGDGTEVGGCVGFNGSSVTGEEVLRASGLEYATEGYGALGQAVCQVDDDPAAYSACLPSGGSSWVLFVSRGGGPWQAADGGISSLTFSGGDAEGLRFDPEDGPDPPPPSPAGVCAAALGGSPVAASGGLASSSPGFTGPGVSPTMVVVAALFGALAGLLVVQLLLRRRRT